MRICAQIIYSMSILHAYVYVIEKYCAMNTLSTENVHWEQVHTGKILLLDVLRGSNKTINLQIYKSYVDASEKNKGMSYNL